MIPTVVLSALLWGGTPYQLLGSIRDKPGTQLYTSAALLEELAEVLTRRSPAKRLVMISKTLSEILTDYLEIVERVEPTTVARVVPTDADDDQVIAAAVVAGADLIVSGDADLLGLGTFQGILILTAAQALERIRA